MTHPRLDRLSPQERAGIRVVVAMSGGVDSSVAAALLKEQGYQVIGMALKTYDLPKGTVAREKSCCSLDDMEDARRVCEKIEIPFYVINTKEEFEARVIEPFVHSYITGRTPNPCINCNTFIKFDFLMKRALELNADYVATGHYAHLTYENDGETAHLRCSRDEDKDQTYFLYNLTQEQLKRTLFPLGVLTKDEVRKLAKNLELPVAEKAESQEICFVDSSRYVDFIKSRVGDDLIGKGPIVFGNKIMGYHDGIYNFTIGQRKGLGIKETDGESYFVTEIDSAKNTVYIGRENQIMSNALLATDMNWIVPPHLLHDRVFKVKIRHGAKPADARVSLIADNQALVFFAAPQRAITPGQGLCIYDGDEVIGGGWIDRGMSINPTSEDFKYAFR